MKKHVFAGLLLSAAILAAPMTANAATVSFGADATNGTWKGATNAWWYELEDGSYLQNGIYNINGTSYLFDENGYAKSGWYAVRDSEGYVNDWYYFDANSGMKTGWVEDGNHWFYLNEDGTMAQGKLEDNGKTYYMDWNNGEMVVDCLEYFDGGYKIIGADGAVVTTPGWHWVKDQGWFYLDGNGAMVKNDWVQSGNTWYYMDNTGRMCTDTWKTIDGQKYYFGAEGAMVTGWYNTRPEDPTSSYWVCCDSNGHPVDGWVQSGASWYYINNGKMVSNQYIVWGNLSNGTQGYKVSSSYSHNDTTQQRGYYMAADGHMVTGWYGWDTFNDLGYKSSTTWRYANGSGELQDGWQKIGGEWYYFLDGVMQRATVIHDVKDYKDTPVYKEYFDEKTNYLKEGKSASDFEKEFEKYYCAHSYVLKTDGTLSKGGWSKYASTHGTTWYYANSDGSAYNGWLRQGNAWYYFECGEMVTNSFTRDGYFVDANGRLK